MKVTSFKKFFLKDFTESMRMKRLQKKFLFLIFVLCMIRYYQMIVNKEVSINEVLPLILAYNNRRPNSNLNVD